MVKIRYLQSRKIKVYLKTISKKKKRKEKKKGKKNVTLVFIKNKSNKKM